MRRLSVSLSLGLMGQGAGGKEMQETIHLQPLGWQYQVRNDLILNYQLSLEQCLFNRRYLLISSFLSGRLGTLSNKVSGGFTLMTGLFSDPYTGKTPDRKFQIYLYTNSLLSLVGYDATLQGGLFNRNSPYVIPSGVLERIVFQNNAGIVLRCGTVYLEYFQSMLTKEFCGGEPHRWGRNSAGRIFLD